MMLGIAACAAALPLPLAGEGWGGGASEHRRKWMDFPHPPRYARRPATLFERGDLRASFARLDPQAGEVSTPYLLPGSEIIRLATSRFQMNSTISAPIVAVMKPAPWSGP
jgi:hypothetical protein